MQSLERSTELSTMPVVFCTVDGQDRYSPASAIKGLVPTLYEKAATQLDKIAGVPFDGRSISC